MPARAQSGGKGGASVAEIKARAEQIQHVYAPRIGALLGVQPREVPINVVSTEDWARLYAGADKQGASVIAFYDPGPDAIFLREDWSNGQTPDQLTSLLVHEMTHATVAPVFASLNGAPGPNLKLFVEGLADYTRNTLTQTNHADTSKNPQGGYQGGAAFFQYVESQHPGGVKAMVQAIGSGDEAPLQAATGQTYDQLRDTYRAAYAKNGLKTDAQLIDEGLMYPSGVLTPKASSGGNYAAAFAPVGPPPLKHLTPHYAAGQPAASTPTPEPTLQNWDPLGGANIAASLASGGTTRMSGTGGAPPPPPGEPLPTDPGGGSGGSSSSSSSTSSAPAVDPVEARKIAMFQSIYSQLWGEPATEAYLKGFKDLNSYEFALNERQKPAWLMSKAFKDTLASRVSLFHSLGL